MTIVDASVWIDYFNGVGSRETDLLDGLLGREPVGIGDLTLTEVLQGFTSDTDYETAKTALQALAFFPFGGKDIAIKSAENYRLLRKKGIKVRKTIDIIIATLCIVENFSLLHSDRDFEPFVTHLGLKVL